MRLAPMALRPARRPGPCKPDADAASNILRFLKEPEVSPRTLRIHNTATRKVEPFEPLEPGKVGLYACGPTVYNYAHIGNLRTYFFEDVLRRTLEAIGFEVRHVMNVTDVGHLQSDEDFGDDKMMLAAGREKKSPWEIARFYEDAFFRHTDQLRIERPTVVCRATDHVPDMIAFIEALVADGHAYESGGNVYFEVSSFERYCDFAGLKLDQQCQTERVEHDERKRHQADFALWFSQSKYPNQIMTWDSPWGIGFPGWHIECSAMATRYLGEHFDIHCGGIDHVPVHHTNEIAQSEARFGDGWVRYWVHGEFLIDETGKMSKSKGEFLHLDRLSERGYDPLDYRYLLLTSHYRNKLHFTWDGLDQARNARRTLMNLIQDWQDAAKRDAGGGGEAAAAAHEARFWDSMLDDLHTPKALTAFWAAARDDGLSAAQRLALAGRFDPILGLGLLEDRRPDLTAEQQGMIDRRFEARKAKDFATADSLRDQLLAEGIRLKDRPDGTDWEWIDGEAGEARKAG